MFCSPRLTHTPSKDLESQVQMESSQASWCSAWGSAGRLGL